MEEAVSAPIANRSFSRILRAVREGRTYIITRHGRPVAKIVPFGNNDREAGRAYSDLLARLRSQQAVDIGRWTRDELYEDGP